MIKIPRLNFAHLPTPIEPLQQLSAHLGGPRLWIKRDDQTGLALGGNKTRKLEFLLAEAQSHGARTLVTAGAAQSNHCRQTAAAAARFGFACILVLSTADGVNEPHEYSGNLLLDRLFGAEIVWSQLKERDKKLQDTFTTAWENGKRPYLIPYGGSNPTGAAGYVFAMEELLSQTLSDTGFPTPDWIVVASSSGGTQAGLAVGARLFNFQGQLLGISIDEEQHPLQERVANLAEKTSEWLAEPIHIIPEEILVNADYLGKGYGVMGETEMNAISLFARHEGILLDPVYTGRAAGGMIDLIKNGFFKTNENVLFWHTGGSPAIFAENYKLTT